MLLFPVVIVLALQQRVLMLGEQMVTAEMIFKIVRIVRLRQLLRIACVATWQPVDLGSG